MNDTDAAGPRAADGLSRTTIELFGDVSGTGFAHAIHTLQRIPGVLFATRGAETNRLTVAHDAGVAPSSLVDALRNGRTRAKLLSKPPPSTIGVTIFVPQAQELARLLMICAGAAFIALAFTSVVFPADGQMAAPAFVLALALLLSLEPLVRRIRR